MFRKCRTRVKTSVERSRSLNSLVKYKSAGDAAAIGIASVMALALVCLVRDDVEDIEAPMLRLLLLLVAKLPG
jgi:hypothetical protein